MQIQQSHFANVYQYILAKSLNSLLETVCKNILYDCSRHYCCIIFLKEGIQVIVLMIIITRLQHQMLETILLPQLLRCVEIAGGEYQYVPLTISLDSEWCIYSYISTVPSECVTGNLFLLFSNCCFFFFSN